MKSSKSIVVAMILGLAVSWWYLKSSDRKTTASSNVESANQASSSSQETSSSEEDLPDKSSEDSSEESSSAGALAPPVTSASGGGAPDVERVISKLDPAAKPRLLRNDQGSITTMRGFKISTYADDEQGMLALSREIANGLGFDGQQMQISETKLDETPETKGFVYDQAYQGYSVYSGYIKILTKKPEGYAYLILNEMKDIGEPDLRIDFDGVEAEQKALELYASKKNIKVVSRSAKPSIFLLRPKVSELAWTVQVAWDYPLGDRRQLMVSAKSGLILEDVTMKSH